MSNNHKKKKKDSAPYHAQVSFIVEDEFILPRILDFGYVSWEQQGLLYCRGYEAPNAAVEVLNRCIIS